MPYIDAHKFKEDIIETFIEKQYPVILNTKQFQIPSKAKKKKDKLNTWTM